MLQLFTYIKMGGTSEQMVVSLLDHTSEVQSSLKHFDAGKSRCFLNVDRQKLLAVIEASFGSFGPFNRSVRAILADKLADKGCQTMTRMQSRRL